MLKNNRELTISLREKKMAAVQQTFEGRVVTVTGAARGIGLATVKYLLARGASVSFSDISGIDEATSSLAEEFPSQIVLAVW
jgi:NAD(P)-dependent dehydrogenase (short-subunit alcohol dehydrogenase family)